MGPWWGRNGWNCRRGFGQNRGVGRMYGSGFGRGSLAFGQPRFQNTGTSREEDAAGLTSYAKELESELEEVKRRIAQLGKD